MANKQALVKMVPEADKAEDVQKEAPEAPKLPAIVEAADMLRLENIGMKREIWGQRAEVARLNLLLLEHEDKDMALALKAKYSLGAGDQIDPASLRIVRG